MKQLRYFFLMVMTCTFTYMQAQNKIPAQTQRYIPIAIDLGLPSGTLWADRNMRENEASTNFGQFYSWGSVVADDEALAYEEHNQRSMTSWRGYKHGSGAKALTKYCTDSAYGKKDDKTQRCLCQNTSSGDLGCPMAYTNRKGVCRTHREVQMGLEEERLSGDRPQRKIHFPAYCWFCGKRCERRGLLLDFHPLCRLPFLCLCCHVWR